MVVNQPGQYICANALKIHGIRFNCLDSERTTIRGTMLDTSNEFPGEKSSEDNDGGNGDLRALRFLVVEVIRLERTSPFPCL